MPPKELKMAQLPEANYTEKNIHQNKFVPVTLQTNIFRRCQSKQIQFIIMI